MYDIQIWQMSIKLHALLNFFLKGSSLIAPSVNIKRWSHQLIRTHLVIWPENCLVWHWSELWGRADVVPGSPWGILLGGAEKGALLEESHTPPREAGNSQVGRRDGRTAWDPGGFLYPSPDPWEASLHFLLSGSSKRYLNALVINPLPHSWQTT